MVGRISRFLAIALGVIVLVLLWLLLTEGFFESDRALDERAAAIEEEMPDPLAAVVLDEGSPEDLEEPDDPDDPELASLGLAGVARIGVTNLAITDKQQRKVLKVKSARTSINLGAMKEGTVRIPRGRIEGAEITLYRDKEGAISLAGALRTQPPTVRRSLGLAPVEKPEGGKWVMNVGPIEIRDTVLTLGFTDKPVKFRIDRGEVRVRQTPDDDKPRIYFDNIEGAMLEPSPLPKPIRIAFARGVVRLGGRPMVTVAARTCIGNSELRIRAVVPKKNEPVEITGDSVGLGGALGRMGLRIAAKVKSDKLDYEQGAVKLEGGPRCDEKPTRDQPPKDEPRKDARAKDEPRKDEPRKDEPRKDATASKKAARDDP